MFSLLLEDGHGRSVVSVADDGHADSIGPHPGALGVVFLVGANYDAGAVFFGNAVGWVDGFEGGALEGAA